MDTNFSSMLYDNDADFTLMLSTLDNHDVEMLSDADFTLMLSTLDNHDVEMLSDADFTLMLPILDGDAQGCWL